MPSFLQMISERGYNRQSWHMRLNAGLPLQHPPKKLLQWPSIRIQKWICIAARLCHCTSDARWRCIMLYVNVASLFQSQKGPFMFIHRFILIQNSCKLAGFGPAKSYPAGLLKSVVSQRFQVRHLERTMLGPQVVDIACGWPQATCISMIRLKDIKMDIAFSIQLQTRTMVSSCLCWTRPSRPSKMPWQSFKQRHDIWH